MMRGKTHRSALAIPLVIALATVAAAANEAEPMKTSWDVPDLQGTWDFGTATPLNRPAAFKDREFLTEEEIAQWKANGTEDRQDDVDAGYDFMFIAVGTRIVGRTSLIVDPPNGRIPDLTPSARRRLAEKRTMWERRPITAADRPPATRCLAGLNSGPPMHSGAGDNIMRVFQAPGYVAILHAAANDHRVIPTDDGKHLAAHVRLWKGDSRGRWEGDILVVETRNFTAHTHFHGSGPNMQLTERFSRVDKDTLRYAYTVDDPESFAESWSTEQDMRATDARIREHACHAESRAIGGE